MSRSPQREEPPNPYRKHARQVRRAAERAECDEPLLLVVALVVALVCGLRVGFALLAEARFGPGASVAALVLLASLWVVRDLVRGLRS